MVLIFIFSKYYYYYYYNYYYCYYYYYLLWSTILKSSSGMTVCHQSNLLNSKIYKQNKQADIKLFLQPKHQKHSVKFVTFVISALGFISSSLSSSKIFCTILFIPELPATHKKKSSPILSIQFWFLWHTYIATPTQSEFKQPWLELSPNSIILNNEITNVIPLSKETIYNVHLSHWASLYDCPFWWINFCYCTLITYLTKC